MKRPFRLILALITALFLVVFSLQGETSSVYANPGDYPQGTITFDGKVERDVTVTAGTKLPFTVNLTKAAKVCKVYVYSLGGPQHGKRQGFDYPRQQASGSVKGSIDTSGYGAGKYRLFMYATTSCQTDAYGHEDDGFDCDGNTTCLRYCGNSTTARAPVDNTLNGRPFEPGDLYRTNSNPAYICSGPDCQKNSCGEKKGSDPTDVTPPGIPANYRVGECELVACDSTGKNLDNLAFTIGSGPNPSSSSQPNPSSSASANPSSSSVANPSAPERKDIKLDKTVDGQVSAPANSSLSVNSSSVVDLSAGVSAVTNNSVVVAGASKNLSSFTGGNLSNVDLTVAQNIGGVDVKVAKAVNIKSSGGVTISNPDVKNVDLKIPADATVLAGSGWNGQIEPPKAVAASTGAPPAGFTVGNIVVSVGSTTETLLFDRPVTLTFTGVSTGAIGYRSPAAAAFTAIDKKCEGTYDNPTPPAFPKECYRISDDNKNTKIVTYHLTDFATLNLMLPQIVSVDPGICWKDSAGVENVAVRLDFQTNSAYSQYQIARKQCKSYSDCSGGVEQFEAEGSIFNRGQPIITPPDDIRVKPGEFWQYRVWGALSALGGTANVTSPSQLDPRFWSLPVVIRVECNAFGSGINIKQLIIPPKATTAPEVSPASAGFSR